MYRVYHSYNPYHSPSHLIWGTACLSFFRFYVNYLFCVSGTVPETLIDRSCWSDLKETINVRLICWNIFMYKLVSKSSLIHECALVTLSLKHNPSLCCFKIYHNRNRIQLPWHNGWLFKCSKMVGKNTSIISITKNTCRINISIIRP